MSVQDEIAKSELFEAVRSIDEVVGVGGSMAGLEILLSRDTDKIPNDRVFFMGVPVKKRIVGPIECEVIPDSIVPATDSGTTEAPKKQKQKRRGTKE